MNKLLAALAAMLMTGSAALATVSATYLAPDSTGTGWITNTATACTVISSASSALSAGWYVVTGTVTRTSRITVSGDVHLILADGCTLTAQQGITVQDDDDIARNGSVNRLTIYAQSTGARMGALTATGWSSDAGIGGGFNGDGGTITINGGTVTATGGSNGAGIGGGSNRDGGTITINGGMVTATGGSNGGAGIGGGYYGDGGTITINGGMVTATGGSNGGAGIGGRYYGGGGTFSTGTSGNAFIVASSIQDKSDQENWCGLIFDGYDGFIYSDNFTLTSSYTIPEDKTLTVTKGKELVIGTGVTLTNAGTIFNVGTITTNGTLYGNHPIVPVQVPVSYLAPDRTGAGWEMKTTNAYPVTTVSSTAWYSGWIVVTDDVTYTNRITVSGDVHLILADGCTLTAEQGITVQDNDNNVTNGSVNRLTIYAQSTGVRMGALTAAGSSYSAGIGGGRNGSAGTITIDGGTVTAEGGYYGAGIGGGYYGSGGRIAINGGRIIATGESGAARIGGGRSGSGGTFSTGKNGNAFIVASSIQDKSDQANWRGLIFDGYYGAIYGTNFTLTADTMVPVDKVLTIEIGKTLTITNGVTLVNDGTIYNAGTITNSGTFSGKKPIVPIPVTYLVPNSADWETKTTNAFLVTSAKHTMWYPGWYVVTGAVVRTSRITVQGDVHLILADGCTLTAQQGITVQDDDDDVTNGSVNRLTIYAQSTGARMGALTATVDLQGAGIGGDSNGDGGTITINGGTVTATGGSNGGAGIGGGNYGSGGMIAINGGKVTARGGFNIGGTGIGGGNRGSCGMITINGGTVIATGGSNGLGIGCVGIGGGNRVSSGMIAINGGTVTATTGGAYEAAIGYVGMLTINGGTVTVTAGGSSSSGISGNVLTINGGTVTVTAGGSISSSISGNVLTINGGTVTVTAGGSSSSSISGNVLTINGGTVTVTAVDSSSSGISGNVLTINGGTVTVTAGGSSSSSISGNALTINGGTVTVTGNINGTFSTGINGHAFIIASSIQDKSDQANWRGVIFESAQGLIYGMDIALTTDATIPKGRMLIVETGKTLTIVAGRTLVNEGTLINNGEIYNAGTITNAGIFPGKNPIVPSPVSYLVPNGAGWETKTTNAFFVTTASPAVWHSGWVVVTDVVARTDRITVDGDVHLILADGCTLNAQQGITVQDEDTDVTNECVTCLTIYAQSTGVGMGRLIAAGSPHATGIGGADHGSCGSITINGGSVTATGGEQAAGIGGGSDGFGGTITFNGGKVTATGGGYAAGIGGGYDGSGGTITLNGGKVTATGGEDGAGIGGGYDGCGGTVILNGGTVTSTGGIGGAGIGGGCFGAGGSFSTGTNGNAFVVSSSIDDKSDQANWSGVIFEDNDGFIYGTNITLTSDSMIPVDKVLTIGIGKTLTIANEVLLINAGTIYNAGTITKWGMFLGNDPIVSVKASATYLLPSGTGWETKTTNAYTVTTVSPTAWYSGWVVVTGAVTCTSRITVNGDVHLILADGCTLDAQAGITVQDDDADVTNGSANSLTIYAQSTGAGMGRLIASGVSNAAGIGGCYEDSGCYYSSADGGTITLNGGMVIATGGDSAAGIGGGYWGSGGAITLNGGIVTSTGGDNAAGIGGGFEGTGGMVTLNGGTVTATGVLGGAGIGGGDGGDGGTIIISGGTVTTIGGEYATGIGGGYWGDMGTFSTGTNGNAFIVASSIRDRSDRANWRGVIFEGGEGAVYGTNVTLTADAIIPADTVLTIDAGKTLTIAGGVTLTNNGTMIKNGTITNLNVPALSVTFSLGGHGTRTGGGALSQSVTYGSEAVAPLFTVSEGWVFTGWNAAFDAVVSNMTVTAQWTSVAPVPGETDHELRLLKNYNALVTYPVPAVGGNGSVSVKKQSGKLPSGITLKVDKNNQSLVLSGKPKETGTFEYALSITGRNGEESVETFRITVVAPNELDPGDEAYNGFIGVAVKTDLPLYCEKDGMTVLGGILSTTIAKDNRISAKFAGVSSRTVSFGGSWQTMSNGTAEAVFETSKGERLFLTLNNEGCLYAEVDGVTTDLGSSFTSSLLPVFPDLSALTRYAGIYTVALPMNTNGFREAQESMPMGTGFVVLKMNTSSFLKTGKVSYTGVFADGSTFNGSTTLLLASDDEAILPIFKRTSKNVACITLRIKADASISGSGSVVFAEMDAGCILSGILYPLEVYGVCYDPKMDLLNRCETMYGTQTFEVMLDTVWFAPSAQYGAFDMLPESVVTVDSSRLTVENANALKFTARLSKTTGIVSGRIPVVFANGRRVSLSYKGVILPGMTPFLSGAAYYSDREGGASVKRGFSIHLFPLAD